MCTNNHVKAIIVYDATDIDQIL